MKPLFLFLILVSLMANCSSSSESTRGYQQSKENAFLNGDFQSSLDSYRNDVSESSSRDRLLHLLEAGIVAHTMGDYNKSNVIFKEAEEIVDSQKTSVTASTASFVLNDSWNNFEAESFEIVILKFYIALNYALLNDLENAKRAFKKVNFELTSMKGTDAKYKQIVIARYMDAIISEEQGKYNDSRVEWKNIEQILGKSDTVLAERYMLAVKEKNAGDQAKYSAGKQLLASYDKNLQSIPFNKKMGEIVVINQAGMAAARESKGKIGDEPVFREILSQMIQLELNKQNIGDMNLTPSAVLYAIGQAENPIPEFQMKESNPLSQEIFINGTSVGKMESITDYSEIAMKNFNENYEAKVKKNAASIATKAVVAMIAAEVAKKAAQSTFDRAKNECDRLGAIGGSICKLAAQAAYDSAFGYAAGKIAGAIVKPDTRSWRLLPSNFQVKRVFLEAGDYDFSFKVFGADNSESRTENFKVKVEAGKPIFINLRTVKNGVE